MHAARLGPLLAAHEHLTGVDRLPGLDERRAALHPQPRDDARLRGDEVEPLARHLQALPLPGAPAVDQQRAPLKAHAREHQPRQRVFKPRAQGIRREHALEPARHGARAVQLLANGRGVLARALDTDAQQHLRGGIDQHRAEQRGGRHHPPARQKTSRAQ